MNLQLNDAAGREAEFLIDRVKHQAFLREYQPLVCDRYIWSGLAYAKVFSPQFYLLLSKVYCNRFFDKPDYYVFMDTPIEVCMQRGKAQTKRQLMCLRDAFLSLKDVVSKDSQIITIEGTLPVEDLAKTVWDAVTGLP